MTNPAVVRPRPHVSSGTRAVRARWADGWAAHRAEAAAVAAGTALVGAQALRLGPWVADEAAVTFAYARSLDEGLGAVPQPGAEPSEGFAGPGWLGLLVLGRRLALFDHGSLSGVPDHVWFPKLLALLCTAGVLAAVAGTARALTHRRGWPVVLLAAGALAVPLPVVRWLFSGLASPLYALALALFTCTLVRGLARGRLLSPRTAAAAGLFAALAVSARTDTAGIAAVFPALALLGPALLRSGLLRSGLRHARLATVARGMGAYGLAFCVPCGIGLLWWHASFGHWFPRTEPPPGATAAALVTAVVLALALVRGGRFRRGACLLLRQAERPYARAAVALAVAGGLALSLTARPAPPQGPSLSFTAQRYGGMFAAYAHRLGLERSTVALPAPGGALLAAGRAGPPAPGAQQILGLTGGTDPQVAAAYAAHDMARLRRYVLDRARPEFVHLDGALTRRTGLTPELLAANGYRPLLRRGDSGDFVHRSAVTAPERLPELRRWARTTAERLHTVG
ncbi:hypothetical protein LHJ74_15600 [Streptomyces sp. N2-109]|uniref:Glycosyltransferase RgtA/B/C/D-like domain-containing protein n=1 Tax=Streptomyces gossypii TaxID=2883101 RepID=A0ABT2JTV5_9ACTN|nr:hypothetical protein [Streptomyces gossypii]MCT2591314.1 hypothetical protein [Streptomyces gossypii]